VEDVAIIGAGPAGSTLAALLARRGVSVALIDREEFPRDKLCGEFLSYDAMPVLEPLGVVDEIDRVNAPRIERCRVVGRHRTYEFDFPHAARGVSRFFFDDLLRRTAIANGARFTLERAEAKVTAGAWGRWGRFDQELNRAFIKDQSHRNFGFKRHYTANGQRPTANEIALHSFKRGYLGVSAIEGGLTNICGLVHATRLAHHKGRWDSFIEMLREEEPRLEELYAAHEPAQENFLSSEPVIFRARSAVEGGIFMVGDASGVIDPLTGNGMAMAIQSALLAAEHIMRVLEKPSDRVAIENEYRERHRAMFGPRIAWSRRTAKLLSRPALLDFALRGARSPAIGRFLLRKTRATREDVARLADRWF